MEQQARKLIALEAQEPLARRADGMWSIWLDAVKRMPAEQKQAELDILFQRWADMSAKEPPYLPAQADWDALFCMMRPLADWWHRADRERFENWRQALHAEPGEQVAKVWAAEIAAVEVGEAPPSRSARSQCSTFTATNTASSASSSRCRPRWRRLAGGRVRRPT